MQRKPDYEKLDPRQKETVLSEVAFFVAISGLRVDKKGSKK